MLNKRFTFKAVSCISTIDKRPSEIKNEVERLKGVVSIENFGMIYVYHSTFEAFFKSIIGVMIHMATSFFGVIVLWILFLGGVGWFVAVHEIKSVSDFFSEIFWPILGALAIPIAATAKYFFGGSK